MGYVLPMQSIQTQLYADRMNMKPYNYANVENIRPIQATSLSEKEHTFQKLLEEEMETSKKRNSSINHSNHFPQHVTLLSTNNLSFYEPIGLNIDTYV
jgi:hypothetical protein